MPMSIGKLTHREMSRGISCVHVNKKTPLCVHKHTLICAEHIKGKEKGN